MVRTMAQIKKILKQYKVELAKNGVRVNRMLLYGSYAAGHPRPYSDIDVVVISSDLAKYAPLKRLEFLAKCTIPLNAPLEVIGYTPKEFRTSKNTIFGQILAKAALSLN